MRKIDEEEKVGQEIQKELDFYKKRWELSRKENEQLKKEVRVIKKQLLISKRYVKSSINKEIEIIRNEQNLEESKCDISEKNIQNLINILSI